MIMAEYDSLFGLELHELMSYTSCDINYISCDINSVWGCVSSTVVTNAGGGFIRGV